MLLRTLPIAALLLVTLSFSVKPQTCSPPAIVANAKSDNIFTAEQETIVGDMTAQKLAGEFRPFRDPALLAYVERIGASLVNHLPPTGLRFRFHIIDYPQANAFNIPGGHVYLTRKLVAFANSEDELASVIAHELGHAAVHHGAVDLSARMRQILKVSSLGDSKDVTDKYNLLIENARTKRVSSSRGHQNEQQLEADRIGFHAMVAAGYNPDASFSFFDRLTESEGKTGSWFSELFGSTSPEQKRLREIAQATKQLPATCRDSRSAKASEEFLRWQADVIRFKGTDRPESIPGLIWKKELSPKLRSDVQKIKFSSDGKFLLVVDDFAITVIDRENLKALRQIPAEDVLYAYFAENNSQVVFTTDNLRFERWDIESGNALEVRELVLRRNCWEHTMSPDGNFLACVDLETNINVIETKTGRKIWEKKKFYPLSFFEYISWLGSRDADSEWRASFFRIGFSPDSRRVLFSRSNKFRFRFKVDGMTWDESENTAVALDLPTLKQIEIGGDIKKVAARPYAFVDSERIAGATEPKLEAAGVFSFPAGKRLLKLNMGGEQIGSTTDANFITLKPLANATIGVFDVAKNQIVAGLNKNDVAVWGDLMAFESASGKIIIRQVKFDGKESLDGKDIGSVEIPVGTMSGMKAAQVSDDFGWAAFSSKTRGGVWNLKTGERTFFTRGFMDAVVDNQGNCVANFPKTPQDSNALAVLNGVTKQGTTIRELPEFGVRQHGRFLLKRTGLQQKEKDATNKTQFPLSDEEKGELSLRTDVKFELMDWMQDKVIWTKEFKGRVPRYSFDSYSGRLILFWRVSSDEGKARLKEDPALKEKAESLGSKEGDYLIEVIDGYESKTVGTLLLETGKGSFSVFSGQSEREWLVLKDTEGRVLVYSVKDGTLRHRFFGANAAINPRQNHLIVENFPGDVALYSLDSGEKLADFTVNGAVSFARFSLDGMRLFLFSDSQVGYAIDLTKIKRKQPIP